MEFKEPNPKHNIKCDECPDGGLYVGKPAAAWVSLRYADIYLCEEHYERFQRLVSANGPLRELLDEPDPDEETESAGNRAHRRIMRSS